MFLNDVVNRKYRKLVYAKYDQKSVIHQNQYTFSNECLFIHVVKQYKWYLTTRTIEIIFLIQIDDERDRKLRI